MGHCAGASAVEHMSYNHNNECYTGIGMRGGGGRGSIQLGA